MDDGHFLHIDRGKAAFDKLDGEIIIVDVETGLYFNLQGSAVAIWETIEAGATVEGLRAHVATLFDGDPQAIRAGVDRMVALFAAEGLLVARPDPPARTAAATSPADRVPYTEPVIERFSDVQDLLTLDPIHDVSDFGWPHAKAPPAAKG